MNETLFVFRNFDDEKYLQELQESGLQIHVANVCSANEDNELVRHIKKGVYRRVLVRIEDPGADKRSDFLSSVLHDVVVASAKLKNRPDIILYGNGPRPQTLPKETQYLSLEEILSIVAT